MLAVKLLLVGSGSHISFPLTNYLFSDGLHFVADSRHQTRSAHTPSRVSRGHISNPDGVTGSKPSAACCPVQDFVRIAAHLDRRSPGDCVQFYYRSQKLDAFAAVRRKLQLRKRRMQARQLNPGLHSPLRLRVIDISVSA
jgi:hypothetical protein